MRNSLVTRVVNKSGNTGIEVSVPAQRTSLAKGARAKSAQRGYVLAALSSGMVLLLGVGGAAIDMGRRNIVESETQAFADSASFAATLQLDGTATGITRAQTAVQNNPKKWQFQKSAFTNVTTSFATASTGPWTTTPPNPPVGYYFVKVQATVNPAMSILGALPGQNSQIAASAVAGPHSTNSIKGGEFSFSPYTRSASPDNAADPFGFQAGNQYTLLWGASGNKTTCGTDATRPNLATAGPIRGYASALKGASLRDVIVGGNTIPLSLGDSVQMSQAAVSTAASAIAWRVNQDTDKTSATYAEYRSARTGNGRRVVIVPVNSGAPNFTNVGFAAFFLLESTYYEGLNGSDSACGVYIGRYLQGQQVAPPAGGSGVFHAKLFQ